MVDFDDGEWIGKVKVVGGGIWTRTRSEERRGCREMVNGKVNLKRKLNVKGTGYHEITVCVRDHVLRMKRHSDEGPMS